MVNESTEDLRAASSPGMDVDSGAMHQYSRDQIGGIPIKHDSPFEDSPMAAAANSLTLDRMLSRTTSTKALEEAMLRQPTAGGRNLSRVESIDRLVNDAFGADPRPMADAGIASDFNTPSHEPLMEPPNLALDRTGDGSSQLLLSRCRSEDGSALQLDRGPDRINSNSGSLAFTRDSRGLGSTWSLFSVDDDLLDSMEDSSASTLGESGAMLINA